MEKVFSINEENWETDFRVFIEMLKNELGTKNAADLAGIEYYEGDKVTVPTEELVDIDAITDIISVTAYEVAGECGNNYPKLSKEEKAELKELIVSFLDKKDAREYIRAENVCIKKIRMEDMEWGS
jgi:hypothetical protein